MTTDKPALAASDGWILAPLTPTPAMLRAAQMKSEAGAYLAANWTGAYTCIEELWRVMLAAAPAAAQPEPRKPLTEKQIQDAWYACGVGDEWDMPADADLIRFARAIERAHGIAAMSGKEQGK